MSKAFKHLKRILGVSLIILSVLIISFPSSVQAEDSYIPVVNNSKYANLSDTLAYYNSYDSVVDNNGIDHILIEDYAIPNEDWLSTYYDNYWGLTITLVGASGDTITDLDVYPSIDMPVPDGMEYPVFDDDSAMSYMSECIVRSGSAAIDDLTHNVVIDISGHIFQYSRDSNIMFNQNLVFWLSNVESSNKPELIIDDGVIITITKQINGTLSIPEGVTDFSYRFYSEKNGVNDYYLPSVIFEHITELDLPSTFNEVKIFDWESDPDLDITYRNPTQGGYFDSFVELLSINISEDNPYYASYDGCIYDKSLSSLLYIPWNKMNISYPPTITYLGDSVFTHREIIDFYLPDTLTGIHPLAFGGSFWFNLGDVVIPPGVTVLSSMYYNPTFDLHMLKSITIPDSNITIESHAISPFSAYDYTSVITVLGKDVVFEDEAIMTPKLTYYNEIIIIRGYTGSTAEKYVENYNESHPGNYQLIFEAIDGISSYTVNIEDKRTDKTNTSVISASTSSSKYYRLLIADSDGASIKGLLVLSNGMSLTPYNISLVDEDGNAVTDFGTCTISLPIPSTMDLTKGRVQAISIDADGNLEKFDTSIVNVDGVDCAVFTTTHFSEYGLLYTVSSDASNSETELTSNGANVGSTSNTNNSSGTTSTSESSTSGSSGSINTTQTPYSFTSSATSSVKPVNGSTSKDDGNNGQSTVNQINEDNKVDMPKTGDDIEIKNWVAAACMFLGFILIISTISTKKRVVVKTVYNRY